ncbi:GNAT family N-acetyltransferase [Pollutibacter soli]|uniref:GNAT family N-acetyltransferase n=1 Tax=Pollutibacter soli TaxID=3034157 RepID=UPI00301355B9
MFIIHTERLCLCALTYDEVVLLSKGRKEFEYALGFSESDIRLNADENFMGEFESALVGYVLPKLEEHAEHFAWYTHWLIVEKTLNLTIGGIGGTGLPDAEGQTMIGYFIDGKFEGKGYATEAVKGFLMWQFSNPDLKSIYADTPVTHIGSQKVLQKAGFAFEGPVEEGCRWRLKRSTFNV